MTQSFVEAWVGQISEIHIHLQLWIGLEWYPVLSYKVEIQCDPFNILDIYFFEYKRVMEPESCKYDYGVGHKLWIIKNLIWSIRCHHIVSREYLRRGL